MKRNLNEKINTLPDYLFNSSLVYQFFNNFLALLLLYKINFLDFFDTGDFFQFFFISRNTKILMETNYWLEMYVQYILKDPVIQCTHARLIYYLFTNLRLPN